MTNNIHTMILCLMILLFSQPSHAIEGGVSSHAAPGVDHFYAAVIPPPGNWYVPYLNTYHASRLNDASGNSAVPDFKVDAAIHLSRVLKMTTYEVLGGQWGVQAIVPLAHLEVTAGGRSQSKNGLGDIFLSPVTLRWNSGNFHWGYVLSGNLPTGAYSKHDLANIGRNYATLSSGAGLTYLDPEGFEAGGVAWFYKNFRNPATGYTSGDELVINYSLAWHFDALTLGATGYYYRQVSDDKRGGRKVGSDGYRGETFAIGPTINYRLGSIPITAAWQHETRAKNRSQGDKLWLKAVISF
ncbi:SphA family protein [Azospirillum griseum]|nr:transporter [Azospirillum griseum]